MKVSERQFHDVQLKERQCLRLVRKLRLDKKVDKVLLIVRIGDDDNLLHILTPKEKDRLMERNRPVVLVGLARDMDGARQVVADIAEHIVGIHAAITGPLIDKELDIHWDS